MQLGRYNTCIKPSHDCIQNMNVAYNHSKMKNQLKPKETLDVISRTHLPCMKSSLNLHGATKYSTSKINSENVTN